MARILTPKYDTTTGNLYHHCPLKDANVTLKACALCLYVDRLEPLAAKYRLHCRYAPTTQLREFEVPKAHNTVQGLTGFDLLRSPRHSWLEVKYDGVRALVHCTASAVLFTTRRRDKSGSFKHFEDNVPHLAKHEVLVALGKKGYSILDGEMFLPVQNSETLNLSVGIATGLPAHAQWAQAKYGLAQLWLFDCPQLLGADIAERSLYERKSRLIDTLRECGWTDQDPHIKIVEATIEQTYGDRRQFFYDTLDQGYEGIVMKDSDAGYFASRAWLKLKATVTVDAQVVGWAPGKLGGKWADTLGNLIVAVHEGSVLRVIGETIPGDDAKREELAVLLCDKTEDEITNLDLVVEMEAQCWTPDNQLRHPRILRWRTDRSTPNRVDFTTNPPTIVE